MTPKEIANIRKRAKTLFHSVIDRKGVLLDGLSTHIKTTELLSFVNDGIVINQNDKSCHLWCIWELMPVHALDKFEYKELLLKLKGLAVTARKFIEGRSAKVRNELKFLRQIRSRTGKISQEMTKPKSVFFDRKSKLIKRR